MPLRDDGLDDIKMEEAKMAAGNKRDAENLTKVVDMHAQVIVTKASDTPIAVVWVDKYGTHVRGIIGSALNHDWIDKNYVKGHSYIEALCRQIAKEDKEMEELA